MWYEGASKRQGGPCRGNHMPLHFGLQADMGILLCQLELLPLSG